jgi:predicted nucleotidyltransferase
MLNRESILAFLSDHSEDIRSFGVDAAGLFGSYARNEAREDSDKE